MCDFLEKRKLLTFIQEKLKEVNRSLTVIENNKICPRTSFKINVQAK